MKVVHLSDTHLGYREYHRTDPETDINQREQDVYDAFEQAVDRILELDPDLVLHAGDLFDSVRPTNRALNLATEQIARLSDAELPTVIIAGNHDTPKIVTTGTMMQSLDRFPHVHAVTSDADEVSGGYRRVEVGDLLVHAVSDASTEEVLRERLEALEPDPEARWNVLMLHAGIRRVAGDVFSGEFNEHHVNAEVFDGKGFDYVALGHYHKRMGLDLPEGTEARYCGATERFSFNETEYKPGFLELTFDDDGADRTVHELATRTFVRLDPIDCEGKSALELESLLEEELPDEEILEGCLLSITLNEIEDGVHSLLEERLLEDLRERAFETSFQVHGSAPGETGETSLEFADLRVEFADFMRERAAVDEELDRDELIEIGRTYLARALGEEDQV